VSAAKLRGRIEAVLAFATARDLRSGPNPASWAELQHILPARRSIAKVEHFPALPYAEVPAFMQDLAASTASPPRRCAS
jgi:hypothetical protein